LKYSSAEIHTLGAFLEQAQTVPRDFSLIVPKLFV
jgi:hypothetical protein